MTRYPRRATEPARILCDVQGFEWCRARICTFRGGYASKSAPPVPSLGEEGFFHTIR